MALQKQLQADPGAVPALGESRAQVLTVLQDAGQPLGVAEVAEQVGLHTNTVRLHLDALVDAGMAERTVEGRDQPGRPRALYTARPDSLRAGRRSYRLLAEILISYVAAEAPRPAEAGVKAGQAWGRYLADRPPPSRRIDAATAIEQLVGVLDEAGFAPEAVASGRERQILLHHCPFRETAQDHPDIVCSVHLGLMQGLLAEVDAPVGVKRLDPFVTPRLCVAHLAAARLGKMARPRRRD
jgi:predicted ArsR family transcriptional regulator